MWAVLKFKKNKLSILKRELEKKLGSSPIIFAPKIKVKRNSKNSIIYESKFLLDDYLICFHYKFSSPNIFLTLKNLRGLKFWLTSLNNSQKNISSFISTCKKNLNEDGFINQSFFEAFENTKGIFINGPFSNMVFEIIEKQKNKFKVLVDNIVTTIPINKSCLFRPI